jgi:hypothetical protein
LNVNINATLDIDRDRHRKVVAAEPVNVSLGALCRDLQETSRGSMDRRDAERKDVRVQVQGGVEIQVHVEVNVNVVVTERRCD